MRHIHMITGGGRSGKSTFALNLAQELNPNQPSLFLATCPLIDDELKERVAKHRAERNEHQWFTIEEERQVDEIIGNHAQTRVILLDCLTLWVNNLMFHDPEIDETAIRQYCTKIMKTCAQQEGTLILVTNEVGLGLVPENAEARLYRDLLGRCNQVFAETAKEVTLMISSIPVKIKP